MSMEQSVKDIEKWLAGLSGEDLRQALFVCEEDPREGIQRLRRTYQKRMDQEVAERARYEGMMRYERTYMDTHPMQCGIDEVGRGPLAGPVVAAAVVLPKDCYIPYLNDSKKCSEKRREELYLQILEKAIAIGVGVVSHERIDEINILQATYEAMQIAIGNLGMTPDILFNDAVTVPNQSMLQIPIIHGDALSVSIAAASIVAKVTRDHMMESYEETYPGYGFASNKGYGSAEHIQRLQEIGPSPIHRRTFIGNFV